MSDFVIENGVLKKYTGNSSTVTVPERVTSIGTGAFWGCSSLSSINLPNSLTSIGALAFAACSGLKSINLPDGVTSIGDWAFWLCSDSLEIHINSLNQYMKLNIGHSHILFIQGKKIEDVTIPDGTTCIETSAF